jgi:glutaryl-CoA dehydrogenase
VGNRTGDADVGVMRKSTAPDTDVGVEMREDNPVAIVGSNRLAARSVPGREGDPTMAGSAAVELDFYRIDDLLEPQEREVRDRVRSFCDKQVLPIINDYWERAEFPFELVPKLAELGLAGGTIQGYGCPGLSEVAAGLVAMELARADGSVCTFFGVHSGLAMQSIALLGSEEQKQRWLPAMARLEKIGAFALTEPKHGSDAVALETSARRDGDHYVLDGAKRWIGNASFADLVIVWARDEDGKVGGFVVEKGTPGFQASVMRGKAAKRAVWQAEITLDGVRVPAANRLARSSGFSATAKVLAATRYGVAWEAVGHAQAAFESALAYANQREQFGSPIAGFQLVQAKLAKMLGELTAMQLLTLRLSQLARSGEMTDGMASLAKMHNAATARRLVADARDILGGNGILLENHVARHQADMEAVFTYEGTDSIQSLIVGREITGLSAFSRG